MVTVERYFQHHIRNWIQELGDNITILDVGCGTGHIGLWLAGEYPMITANCQDKDYDERHKLKELHITGLDSYQPSLNYLSRLGIYSNLTNYDLREGLDGTVKFDIALAYGVMAHLKKEESLKLVEDMLKFANHVIVTAPTQMVQHENINNSASIEQLQHKAIFTCRDFEDFGLQTRMLSYKENPEKMTTLNTFVSPWTFLMSAVHARQPFRRLHKLNYFGDGIIAWREKK